MSTLLPVHDLSARTEEQVETVAAEIGGLAVPADVSSEREVERMVAAVESSLGPVELLVANAGIAHWERETWTMDVPPSPATNSVSVSQS